MAASGSRWPRPLCVVAGVMALAALWCGMAGAEGAGKENEAMKVETIVLWPGGAPGARGTGEADVPTLTVFRPTEVPANGAGVIVCPGGAYMAVVGDYEGADVARVFNKSGVTAFVLRYRVAPYYHPAPLQDAQRAIRTVRARGEELGVKPDRLGILGFSAGGHLVSTTGTHFDSGDPDAVDPVERQGSRPDFMVTIYPVISMTAPFALPGCTRNLLGPEPNPVLAEYLSSELQVTRETPPAFLVASSSDTMVPVEHSLVFYSALRKAGVPAELHVFERGQHGFALATGDPALGTWPALCLTWMRDHGWIRAE